MKKLLLIGLLALFPSLAQAQCNGVFNANTVCGNNTGSPRTPFAIPASTNLSGPGTTVVNDLVLWGNISGTALIDKAPSAFTKTDDTNVTMTLGGTPTTALVNAMSVTMGWSGTLAAARLNANVVQAFTNDTNITASITAQNATLGWTGTLAAGRLNSNVVQAFTNDTNVQASITAQNATLAWAGQLSIARGGTGASTQSAAAIALLPTPVTTGDVIYWNGSQWVTLAGNGVGTQFLSENSSGVPSWATVSGTGTVTSITPGSGLVSSVAASCLQTAITSSGTLSKAECVNPQTGTTYTIVDGDRAKLLTASNAAAQAYTLPQAGAASSFVSDWYVDIKNVSATAAGVLTITPTTSTINGAATLVLLPGQSARIVSDGTNYQSIFGLGQPLTSSLNADVAVNNTANYFDGPTVTQGTLGTWLATGAVTITDTVAGNFQCKLWDGTTIIASGAFGVSANFNGVISLSGFISSPAGNIRMSVKNATDTTGTMLFNKSGNSKDSTLTVVRIH